MRQRTYYFTFGNGQRLAGKVQPIVAPSEALARDTMILNYNLKWGFCYNEEEWEAHKRKCTVFGYEAEEELPPIYYEGDGRREVVKL